MDSPLRRPILALAPALAYLLLWADLFLPSPPIAVLSPPWFGLQALKGAFRTAVLLLLWPRLLPGTPMPAARPLPRAKDLAGGLGVGASLAALALLLSLLALAAGWRNPLFGSYPGLGRPGLAALLLLPLSCLGTGYSEELFFRCFAPQSLEAAGFPLPAAQLASACVFGLSHLGQGLFGALIACIYALLLSFFRKRGSSLHSLALGHAVYDLGVLAALFLG